MDIFLTSLISYCIGSVSGSFLLGKMFKNIDIRKEGSGNAGTTNAIRVVGLKFGAMTFIIDFIKGLLTIFLIRKLLGNQYVYLAALFCVLGHDFPFYMKFKGGKGVATTAGCYLLISPISGGVIIVVWILILLLTRLASLSSIILYVLLPILILFFEEPGLSNILLTMLITILGLMRHKENLKRLMSGTEKKLGG